MTDYMRVGVLRTGAVMPCSYKNTLCQDKQWSRIWWIFLSRDNEVQLTPIKLNWASATGLFQRRLRRAGWKPKPTLFAKERESLLKKSPERCRNALSSWEWSRGVSSNSQVMNCHGLSEVFWIPLIPLQALQSQPLLMLTFLIELPECSQRKSGT